MKICDYSECTGCAACTNICPKHCIEIREDEYGTTKAYVSEKTCINCGACKRVCPNNATGIFYNYPKACYAGWMTNKKDRCECASGGAATFISEYFIDKKHGIVFGTSYDKDLNPKVTFGETVDSLDDFKGSKYVQSMVGDDTYKKMKTFLNEGRKVLFIGTPCQIAAARNVINDDENFYTVDLICHGVTPTRYFKDEIEYIIKKNRLKDINNVRFRGNDINNNFLILWDRLTKKNHNNFVLTLWKKGYSGKRKVYTSRKSKDYYLYSFLHGITLRENCYSCKYARPERVGDITVGDFIGIDPIILNQYKENNISIVLSNSEKGYKLYKEALDYSQSFISIERSYDERLKNPHSLKCPFPRHKLRDTFLENYKINNFHTAIRNTIEKEIRIYALKNQLYYLTYIYRIPRKIFRIIKKLFV